MQTIKENKRQSANGSINQKLKSYSALAGATLATTAALNAQVVYTDIDPDSVITGFTPAHFVDINNDGVDDIKVWIESETYLSGLEFTRAQLVSPLGNNRIITEVETTYVHFYGNVMTGIHDVSPALFPNDLIDSNNDWQSAEVFMGFGMYNGWWFRFFGPWRGAFDRFLGVELDISGQVHYGWVRLSANSLVTQATIKDYAYELIPDSAIIAGAGITVNNCADPMGLSTINVLPLKAKLTWNLVLGATKYKVYYKEVGTPGGPLSKNSIDNIRTINNLNPSTTYTAKVKAWCPGIGWSDLSAPITFTTPVMREGAFEEYDFSAAIYSFHKNIHLQIHDWQDGMKAEVAIFDILGKRIYQSQLNQQNEVIDLQSQSSGIYIVELKMGDAVQRKKVYLRQ